MSTKNTTTTTAAAKTATKGVPTAKVFATYVAELVKAGAEVEKAAARIALAAARQAAHRSSLSYLNAAYAAFKECHVSCIPQLTKYVLGVFGGLTAADDKGKPGISRSKSVLRVCDAQERRKNGGDAFAWTLEKTDPRAKEECARARNTLCHPEFTNFLAAPTAVAKYIEEDGLTVSQREIAALLKWVRRTEKTSAKRAGERGYRELQEALTAIKAVFPAEFE